MVTVILPSRNEKFLPNTIEEVLTKARGEIEVYAILDGYWPNPPLKDDPRLHVIHRGTPQGMRAAINAAAALAKGEYLMKLDAHCMLDEGYDVKLVADCEDNWICIPSRKRLDADKWEIQDVGKPDVDYECISYPDVEDDFGGPGLNGKQWNDRSIARKHILIDDTPASQGSCWFMKKTYFYELELMDEASYGTFWNESQELAFKCILSGGRYVTNKKTWYAHLHKGKKHGRGYNLDHNQLTIGRNQTIKYFYGQKVWHKQLYPFSYLIEKFPGMPGWTDERIQELKERESLNFK